MGYADQISFGKSNIRKLEKMQSSSDFWKICAVLQACGTETVSPLRDKVLALPLCKLLHAHDISFKKCLISRWLVRLHVISNHLWHFQICPGSLHLQCSSKMFWKYGAPSNQLHGILVNQENGRSLFYKYLNYCLEATLHFWSIPWLLII